MAGIIGQFAVDPFLYGETNANLSTELNELVELVPEFEFYEVPSNLDNAGYDDYRLAGSNRWPIYAQRKMFSFFDDFYNRIYITPANLSLGNLLSNQTRDVYVWNAFFETKELTAAELAAQSGLTLVPPVGVTLPYDLQPLQEIRYQLLIQVQGPPTIDSSLTFTIDGVDYVVPITGRRVILWPFAPQWGSPFDETITMRGWVIPAIDGSEQTGSSWGNQPRRQFEYNIVLKDAVEAQRAENLLFGWQSRFFGAIHWAEESLLDTAASSGSHELLLDTYGMTLSESGLVAIYLDNRVNEIREVESFDANSITLVSPLDLDWPVGTRVYPCFVGLMDASVSGARETTRVGRMAVSFECEPSVTEGNTATGAPPLTYRGEELYLGRINWKGALPITWDSDRDKLDFNTGKFTTESLAGFSAFTRKHNWTLYDRTEILAFRAFCGRRQGVAVPVYMPSGMEDFELVENINADASAITVRNNEYALLVDGHPARRDIIIQLHDGTYFCRRILGSSQIAGTTSLSIDSDLGVDVDVADVLRISYLHLYRLDSNEVTLRHVTNSKATVDANMRAKRPKDIA